MKDNLRLIAITIVFVVTGLLLGYFALQNSGFMQNSCVFDEKTYDFGTLIPSYQENSTCTCGRGGVIECVSEEKDFSSQESLSMENFNLKKEGLKFEYSYLRGLTNVDENVVSSPVSFTSLDFKDNNLIVVLEQIQVCPSVNVAYEQVGLYENVDNVINLYNMIRPSESTSATNCIVQIKYVFENLQHLDLNKMRIAFVDDNGFVTNASMCIYNDKVYSDGDAFLGMEEKICTCEKGVVSCGTDLPN